MKKELLHYCHEYCAARLARIQGEIEKITQSLSSEAKSTAGDKHETGRAMLQLEREKLGKQLLEAERMKLVLNRISLDQKNAPIALGSLVVTDKANYYLAISAGKFNGPEGEVFCISASSPIGQLLLGKSVGDTFWFKGQASKIVNIK